MPELELDGYAVQAAFKWQNVDDIDSEADPPANHFKFSSGLGLE
jgi:hypothetical protein